MVYFRVLYSKHACSLQLGQVEYLIFFLIISPQHSIFKLSSFNCIFFFSVLHWLVSSDKSFLFNALNAELEHTWLFQVLWTTIVYYIYQVKYRNVPMFQEENTYFFEIHLNMLENIIWVFDQLARTLHAIFLCNQFSNGLNFDKSRKVDVNLTKFKEKKNVSSIEFKM